MGNFGNALPEVQETRLPQSNLNMLADAVSNFGQVATQQGRIIDEQQRQQEVTAKNLELYNNQLEAKEGQLKLDESLSTDFNDKVVDIKTVLVMEQSTLNKQMKNSIHFHLKSSRNCNLIYRVTLRKI